MYILGIETSCDETAASVVEADNSSIKILSNVVASQIKSHKKYGGVVPELAAREHVLNILPVIDKALTDAKIKREQVSQKIDAIAVTKGPGLITSLLIGVETAKVLAYTWNIPIVAVNHIEGHVYSPKFVKSKVCKVQNFEFPALILTVSGGHTFLILMHGHGKYKIIGKTLDDAAGEAFDKAAKMMGLEYPGGPIISQKSKVKSQKSVKLSNIKLPRPMLHSKNYDFSFSGLKTALLYSLEKEELPGGYKNWKKRIPEYCHEFQQAIIDCLIHKTIKAAKELRVKTIVLTGGVSANIELRKQMQQAIDKNFEKMEFSMSDIKYCGDNAAMIAMAGYQHARKKNFTPWQDLKADPNLKL